MVKKDILKQVEELTGHGNARNLKEYWDAGEAVEAITKIYNAHTTMIRDAFLNLKNNDTQELPTLDNATYPYLGISITNQNLNVDARVAYGAVLEAGVYGTTLTRPDLFKSYYTRQIDLLIKHHDVPVVVGESDWQIPLPFVDEWDSITFEPDKLWQAPIEFALPNLTMVDDSIVNGTYKIRKNQPLPMALFTGERVDFSLSRLAHYCGTSARHFQKFILLTNYQRYIDEFVRFAHEQIREGSEYSMFVEPGDHITYNPKFSDKDSEGHKVSHLPQMPGYHLVRPDGLGITFINIGVGPSNAKTITDHLAVLRPHCWLMLGHCAGLRRSQILGDYVLAHAYVREDDVLDQDLPPWIPVPAIAEIQVALQQAVANVTGESGAEIKSRMRTGTVATTGNRNWELRSSELMERFRKSRAIAIDMESATIAANGFRMRVPYGTLLCVSDKPLHGELKLKGMANNFYRERVRQHLEIGLETIRLLQTEPEFGGAALHSRKLRSFDEPPFR